MPTYTHDNPIKLWRKNLMFSDKVDSEQAIIQVQWKYFIATK